MGGRETCSEELYSISSLSDINRGIKWSRVRRAAHVACMVEVRYA